MVIGITGIDLIRPHKFGRGSLRLADGSPPGAQCFDSPFSGGFAHKMQDDAVDAFVHKPCFYSLLGMRERFRRRPGPCAPF